MKLRLPTGYHGTAETEVRRSRFLALVARTDTEAEARAVVAAARKAHPDARHHCSAFILDGDGAHATERSSDDGEPSGTAGAPMLDVLRGAGLVSVTAVVTRWFGGVKLGTGGLARAYGEAISAALADAPRVIRVVRPVYGLACGHDVAGRWEADLLSYGAEVTAAYDADAVRFRLVHDDPEALAGYVAGLTQGRGTLIGEGSVAVEVPAQPVPPSGESLARSTALG
jgi:uncharacterized YigZ family protein